jgi:hypothetical protein
MKTSKNQQECWKCHATKPQKFQKQTEPQQMPQYSLPNLRLHMDIFSSCKTSHMGTEYVLTMADALSKYEGMVAIPSEEAETMADAVLTRWSCR